MTVVQSVLCEYHTLNMTRVFRSYYVLYTYCVINVLCVFDAINVRYKSIMINIHNVLDVLSVKNVFEYARCAVIIYGI